MTHRIIEIHPFEKPVSELYVQRIYRVEVSCYCKHNKVYKACMHRISVLAIGGS